MFFHYILLSLVFEPDLYSGTPSPPPAHFFLDPPLLCEPRDFDFIVASLSQHVTALMLGVPKTSTDIAQWRAFSFAAPPICNSLPADVPLCRSVTNVKQHLKARLFHTPVCVVHTAPSAPLLLHGAI